MRDTRWLVTVILFGMLGCGPAESVIPTDPLTEEQKAAIKVEDEAIANEESAGNYRKANKKKT